MQELRMSEREKKLTAMSNCGKEAFYEHWRKPDAVKNDPAMSQAWDNGYRIAKEQAARDHKIGFW